MASETAILVGQKPVANYVLAAVTQFTLGSKRVTLKARGRAVSKAVDAAEVVRHFMGEKVDIASVKITSEKVGEPGKERIVSAIEIVLEGKQPPAREAGKVGLGGLVEALEMTYSRGKSCEVSELLEVLKTVNELERVYGLAEAEREGGGSLKAMGLLVIREYVKEAIYRLSTGEDPSALLGEALSVAKALQELEALAEKGARIVGLEDLEVVGYVEGKPVYSFKPRGRPDR